MRFQGYGKVWDAEEGKDLAEFRFGEFETEDPEIIEKMIQAGFVGEDDSEDETEVELLTGDEIDIPEVPEKSTKKKKGKK
jgi:hypothetical protein